MNDPRPETPSPPAATLAPRREIFAWAMYDFANSGYTTVVLTAVIHMVTGTYCTAASPCDCAHRM